MRRRVQVVCGLATALTAGCASAFLDVKPDRDGRVHVRANETLVLPIEQGSGGVRKAHIVVVEGELAKVECIFADGSKHDLDPTDGCVKEGEKGAETSPKYTCTKPGENVIALAIRAPSTGSRVEAFACAGDCKPGGSAFVRLIFDVGESPQ